MKYASHIPHILLLNLLHSSFFWLILPSDLTPFEHCGILERHAPSEWHYNVFHIPQLPICNLRLLQLV